MSGGFTFWELVVESFMIGLAIGIAVLTILALVGGGFILTYAMRNWYKRGRK